MGDLVIAFGLDYGNELIYCEVIMAEHSYDVHFDGKWIASVEYTDQFSWIQASGTILPQIIIDEIGDRIEHNYN